MELFQAKAGEGKPATMLNTPPLAAASLTDF